MADPLQRLTEKKLGPEKGQAPQAAPQPQPQGPAPKPADAPTTNMEKAQEMASPQTEGDRTSADPVEFLKVGDQTMTAAQIKGTRDRYAALNNKHSQNAEVYGYVDQMMEKGNMSPSQAKALIDGSLKRAFTKNAQFGKGAKPPAGQGQANPNAQQGGNVAAALEEEFRKYEDSNAISLPPKLRESYAEIEGLKKQMAMQTQLMNRVMQAGKQQAQASQQIQKQASNQSNQSYQERVATNLDRVQQELKLPDEMAPEFSDYAMQMGYTGEDFADLGLTRKVMKAFQNEKNSGEFERLKSFSEKRAAFTETNTTAPTSSGGQQGSDDMLNRLTQRAQDRRVT